MNIIQANTILLFRNNMMYPKNKEDFFKNLSTLDSNKDNIDKVLKNSFNLYFTITQYYKENEDEIQAVIKSII